MTKECDNGGVRTHALSDWRLKPAPWTTRPRYLATIVQKIINHLKAGIILPHKRNRHKSELPSLVRANLIFILLILIINKR